MILSFKKQFPDLIKSGSKIHTIRLDPHNRWKPGRKIHFATGVRTKDYNCFKEDVCCSVQSIRIWHNHTGVRISIDNRELNREEIKNLSINDGFSAIKDFRNWFIDDFEGKIIHWTNFKY